MLKYVSFKNLEELRGYYLDAVAESGNGSETAFGVRRGVTNTLQILGVKVDFIDADDE